MANYWQKAINAVFYACPVEIQQIIDEGHFCSRLLEDMGLMTKPFPIWRIPQCWEDAIGEVSHWSKPVQYLIADFKTRVSQVKKILGKSFNIEFTPNDYQMYTDDFYAAKSDESLKDYLVLDSIEEAYKFGARPIDVDLYHAGVQFNFERVKELLEQGANPDIPLEEYDNYLYDRIDAEAAILEIELRSVWKYGYRRDVNDEDIGHLVGYAAHERMYDLLKQYHKNTEGEKDSGVFGCEEKYVFGPDTDADTAKLWWITNGHYADFTLVTDASRTWVLEMPFGEKNLDNYRACITANTKEFRALYGGEMQNELALNIHRAHWKADSFDSFIEKVKGMKEFKILDYRLADTSPELDKFIHGIVEKRYHTLSQEYVMNWYRGVAICLRKMGLSDDDILQRFKRKNIPVLWIKNHCSSSTYEDVARKYLISEE